MITVTFTADSIDQLREQMLQLLNGPYGDALPAPEFIPTRPKAGRKKVAPAITVEDMAIAVEDSPAPREEVRASPEPAPAEDEEKVNVPATKELLELKERVINELNAEYRKGKVEVVGSFLVKYGKGAKSFRQIDINDFPVMDAAIKAGALG